MPAIQHVHIVYFSGTGGTARFAAHIASAFSARGRSVTLTALDGLTAPHVPADLRVLLFPVHAANAPAPVDDWLHALPPGNGAPVAVLSVSGGGEVSPNTACRVATIRALRRKSYAVPYERMLVMPSNFIMPYPDALSALLLRQAPLIADRITEELLAGVTRRARPLATDRLLSRLTVLEKRGSKYFGRKLQAGDACTGCGWCESHCPRGNISLAVGKPVFGDRCVLCLRCVYGCPGKAIRPGLLGFAVLKEGFNLDTLQARTQAQTEFPPLAQLARGWVVHGVYRYLHDEGVR